MNTKKRFEKPQDQGAGKKHQNMEAILPLLAEPLSPQREKKKNTRKVGRAY